MKPTRQPSVDGAPYTLVGEATAAPPGRDSAPNFSAPFGPGSEAPPPPEFPQSAPVGPQVSSNAGPGIYAPTDPYPCGCCFGQSSFLHNSVLHRIARCFGWLLWCGVPTPREVPDSRMRSPYEGSGGPRSRPSCFTSRGWARIVREAWCSFPCLLLVCLIYLIIPLALQPLAVIGCIIALIQPTFIMYWIWFRKNRRHVPLHAVAGALFIGFLSIVPAIILELALGKLATVILHSASPTVHRVLYSLITNILIVGPAEEGSKYFCFSLLVRRTWPCGPQGEACDSPGCHCNAPDWRRSIYYSPMGGWILGVVVALGFEIAENVEYVMFTGLANPVMGLLTALMRAVMPMHPAWVSVSATRSIQGDWTTEKWPFWKFLWLPALLHGLFDFSAGLPEIVAKHDPNAVWLGVIGNIMVWIWVWIGVRYAIRLFRRIIPSLQHKADLMGLPSDKDSLPLMNAPEDIGDYAPPPPTSFDLLNPLHLDKFFEFILTMFFRRTSSLAILLPLQCLFACVCCSSFFSGFCGLILPAYQTFKILAHEDEPANTERRKPTDMLAYWTCFSALTSASWLSDPLLFWAPFYWDLKVATVLWLASPKLLGANHAFRLLIAPHLTRWEDRIDAVTNRWWNPLLTTLWKINNANLFKQSVDMDLLGVLLDGSIEHSSDPVVQLTIRCRK